VLLVDDGLATGASARAAVTALRMLGPRRILVATPVASREALASLAAVTDDLVAVANPRAFLSVGSWYRDFREVDDHEVRSLLEAARGAGPSTRESADYNPSP
jgi:predicted phosphoribosyltransferase